MKLEVTLRATARHSTPQHATENNWSAGIGRSRLGIHLRAIRLDKIDISSMLPGTVSRGCRSAAQPTAGMSLDIGARLPSVTVSTP